LKSQVLILSFENVELLGGHVGNLEEAWRVNKEMDRNQSKWGANLKINDSGAAGGGPPLWKPFDSKQPTIKLQLQVNKNQKFGKFGIPKFKFSKF
jgi:hypothetical protein